MARRDLKVRELVDAGIVKPTHINTKENLADIYRTFQALRNKLMNIAP